MSRVRRKIDDLMLGDEPLDLGVSDLASNEYDYRPEPTRQIGQDGIENPNLAVAPLVDDYMAEDAPPAPIQDLARVEPPSDDDAWIGELASRFSAAPTRDKSGTIERGQTTAIRPDEEQTARQRSDEIMNNRSLLGGIAAFLDPRGEPARAQARKTAADQPMKEYREGQRLAQDRRDAAARKEEMDRRFPLQERRVNVAEQNANRGDRGEDRRWLSDDPRSQWSDAENAEYDRRQEEAARRTRERDVFTGNTADDRRRRGVVASGNPALLRQEGVLDSDYSPSSQQESIASQLEQMSRNTPGYVLTNRDRADLAQIAKLSKNNPLRAQLIRAYTDRLDQFDKQHGGTTAPMQAARRQAKIPKTVAAIDQSLSLLEGLRDPEGDIPGLSRWDRAVSGVPIIDSLNRLSEGDDGAASRSAVATLEETLKRLNTGAAVAGHELPGLRQVLSLDWTASQEAVLAAVRNWRDRLTEEDIAIIQGFGVPGAEIIVQRERPARSIAPHLQPGQAVSRGGRVYEVIE